jgi:hypothetical protein
MSSNFKHRALTFAGVLSTAFLGLSTVTAEAQYQCRWDKVGGAGGPWAIDWVPGHKTPNCGASAVNRVCGTTDGSAAQPSGAVIAYWPQGCGGPQWTIKCTCRPG